MKPLEEMPATLLRQRGEDNADTEWSRAAREWSGGQPVHAQGDDLDDGVVHIHAAVVMVLRRI